jgi:hypothetical protein
MSEDETRPKWAEDTLYNPRVLGSIQAAPIVGEWLYCLTKPYIDDQSMLQIDALECPVLEVGEYGLLTLKTDEKDGVLLCAPYDCFPSTPEGLEACTNELAHVEKCASVLIDLAELAHYHNVLIAGDKSLATPQTLATFDVARTQAIIEYVGDGVDLPASMTPAQLAEICKVFRMSAIGKSKIQTDRARLAELHTLYGTPALTESDVLAYLYRYDDELRRVEGRFCQTPIEDLEDKRKAAEKSAEKAAKKTEARPARVKKSDIKIKKSPESEVVTSVEPKPKKAKAAPVRDDTENKIVVLKIPSKPEKKIDPSVEPEAGDCLRIGSQTLLIKSVGDDVVEYTQLGRSVKRSNDLVNTGEFSRKGKVIWATTNGARA